MQIEMIRLQARNLLSRFVKNEAGITAIEYAVLAAGVAVLIVAVTQSGGSLESAISTAFQKVKDTVTGTTGSGGG